MKKVLKFIVYYKQRYTKNGNITIVDMHDQTHTITSTEDFNTIGVKFDPKVFDEILE